ncbi:MAG TPA: hypothetical protein PLM07_18530 [Candidatus Rifleibacterium sp.]|nr:hypothetical protein [Candidatus Rifleibacterium sp.]HPT47880.1 hypothetical protein [Candidatus Rifleibacterium sp.]
MPGFRLKISAVIAIFVLINAGLACAQVSLLPEHNRIIDGVTLLRDSHNAARWYYIPERPVLLERNPSDKNDPRPVFQLMTYQAANQAYEGGVLQFCVSLGLTEARRKSIETSLKNLPEMKGLKVSLAPLPFHKAEAFLFDAAGLMNSEGTQAPGLAPAYITGALPFQLNLKKFDADLYSALVDTSGGGVGVLMKLGFEGVLPPAGFQVTIDWDQTYDFVSENKETRVALGTCNFGVDIGISKTKIRETLISNGCMKVESLTNEAVTNETIDRYLDPVIEKLQQTLIAKIHPPEKIDLESRSKPDSFSRCFFPAKSSVVIETKSRQDVKTGSETFIFNQSVVVERHTSCGAFIGINAYPESVKKRLVTTMPLDSWASAFLLLPGVENSPELHIRSVSMSAEVVDHKGRPLSSGLSDTATWSAEKPAAWLNRDGDETGSLKFPLMALFKAHDNDIDAIRKEYHFKVDVSIFQSFSGGKLLEIKKTCQVPIFDGDLPLPPAIDLVDPVVFDVSALSFSNSGLKKVRIQMKPEGSSDRFDYTFPQRKGDETSVIFLVASPVAGADERPAQLLPTITFETAGNKVLWQNNDKDLRAIDPNLYFMLFDSDWEKP